MLEMLRWIQTMRNPLLDHFFIGITILGEEYFAIAVICLLLWCVNKKAGYRIGFAYISSWILNFSLKEIIHLPRPFELDKRIIPLRPETATGYSFPSGHTQSLTSLVTAVTVTLKRKWMYLPGILLIFLIAGTFTGLMLGYFLDSFYINYQVQGNIRQKTVNYILGIAVLLLIKTLVKKALGESLPADFFRYFLIGTWITVLAPMLFKRIWRKGSKYSKQYKYSAPVEHTKL